MSLPTSSNPTQTSPKTSPKTWAIVVWGLYIASYFTFALTMIAGLIIAYVKRGDLIGTPFESHMTSAIRTFWISLIVGIIGFLLMLLGIGFLILGVLAVWQLFRVIRGLIRAMDDRPIDDPQGWL